jgi:hypothetical protein
MIEKRLLLFQVAVVAGLALGTSTTFGTRTVLASAMSLQGNFPSL